MSYHYTDSGLDGVFLDNGYREHATPYGPGVSIADSAGLHRTLGRWLIDRLLTLTGAELRFLRLEMDLTQLDLAELIGSTEQTLRLWEKHRSKHMPGPPDRLVRALYAETLGDEHRISDMLKKLVEGERGLPSPACFRRTRDTWKRCEMPVAGGIEAPPEQADL